MSGWGWYYDLHQLPIIPHQAKFNILYPWRMCGGVASVMVAIVITDQLSETQDAVGSSTKSIIVYVCMCDP